MALGIGRYWRAERDEWLKKLQTRPGDAFANKLFEFGVKLSKEVAKNGK